MQCYYYYPTQQINEAPNTHKQNATRRPSLESVRALAMTAAAPHVCCVLFCMYVCCVVLLSPLWLLLCFWCGGFRASKYTGVPLSVPGYPILPENPTNTLGFWGHARILPGIGLVFWFSIDGSQPYSTQHTHSTQHHHHHQGIAHQTAHSTPEWVCVLRPPRRLEGAGNNAASNGETLRYIAYIAFDIYRGIGKTSQPIDR